jgi:predicted phage baseplate assembly protein
MLDFSNVPNAQTFTIELQSPDGSVRPPRVLRIEPNVIPIRQGRSISRELHVVTGVPDATFKLDVPGLRFDVGEEPVEVEVSNTFVATAWTRCDRLSERGPDDRMYELDPQTGEITFGNGINGMMPPAQSQVLVSYAVCDAAQGNVARNRRWEVAGFQGVFGANPDAVKGGAAPSGFIDQRREARRLSREDHALVSSADIELAAKELPLLEVARAWVLPPDDKAPRTGEVRLIVMRSRIDGNEPESVPETARWLDSIRRRLAPRMPLGTRLGVTAPRYVEFSIAAQIECEQGRDPAIVEEAVRATLRQRLALVDVHRGLPPREPGVPVTPRDVAAWIRATDGVRRISAPRLLNANGESVPKVAVSRGGLPRWSSSRSTILVSRPGTGGAE